MESPFTTQLQKQLATVFPTAYEQLEELDQFPQKTAEMVVEILLQGACQSQNLGNIQASRQALARIPRDWLRQVLPAAIARSLNIEDEWEFRRLLELLKELAPELMSPIIESGLASQDVELHEAAEDFASITAGKKL